MLCSVFKKVYNFYVPKNHETSKKNPGKNSNNCAIKLITSTVIAKCANKIASLYTKFKSQSDKSVHLNLYYTGCPKKAKQWNFSTLRVERVVYFCIIRYDIFRRKE